MDKPMSIRSGVLVTALCAALVALLSFMSSHAVAKMQDHDQRISRNEAAIQLLMETRSDMGKRLDRIDEKLDRLLEQRRIK